MAAEFLRRLTEEMEGQTTTERQREEEEKKREEYEQAQENRGRFEPRGSGERRERWVSKMWNSRHRVDLENVEFSRKCILQASGFYR